MVQTRNILARFLLRAVAQDIIKRLRRYEGINESAVHRLSRLTQRLDRGGSADFGLLNHGNARNRCSHTSGKLADRHAKSFAYCLYPASWGHGKRRFA